MSKFFSLDWFKSKIEQSVDRIVEKRINSIEEEDIFKIKKVMLVNNNLTIILEDGQMFHKNNATEEDFVKVEKAKSLEDIYEVISDGEAKRELKQQQVEERRNRAISKGLDLLKDMKTFKVENERLFLSDINRTIPILLAEKFIEVVYRISEEHPNENLDKLCNQDNEFLSLKRFFMWCCLNPRAEVAKELYRFLTENSFRITKQGFFVALRNVVSLEKKNGTNIKVQFISNAYNKIKAVWKKNPKNFEVWERLGEYKLINLDRTTFPEKDNPYWNRVGNLHKLYLDLPNMSENRFTDDWTKTFDIRVGKVVQMPKEECNWSTQDCAASGLHFTADQIHYVGCGDTSMLILINPMKVVGIGAHKGRCYEYLPIMTVPREEATKILHDADFDTLELEENYAVEQLNNLAEIAKEGFATESKKDEFNLSPISSREIKLLVSSLSDMKAELKKRVVNLD